GWSPARRDRPGASPVPPVPPVRWSLLRLFQTWGYPLRNVVRERAVTELRGGAEAWMRGRAADAEGEGCRRNSRRERGQRRRDRRLEGRRRRLRERRRKKGVVG